MTLREYAETWTARIEGSKAHGTVINYKLLLKLHILPFMGDDELPDIKRRRIKGMLVTLRGATHRGKPSPSVAGQALACLSSLLGDAVSDELLEFNPAHKAGKGVLPKHVEKPPKALDDTQMATFLATAETLCPEWVTILCFVAARTGARPGECLALERADVNLEDRLLRIDDTYGHYGFSGRTKTGKTRYVPMADDLAVVLAWRLASQPDRWLFPSATTPGKPWNIRTLDAWYKRVVTAAGLPAYLTPHSGRHTFGTSLAERGVLPLDIQRLMDHATITQTERYTQGARRQHHHAEVSKLMQPARKGTRAA